MTAASWATYADQPLDPGQRDALVSAQVLAGASAERLDLPDEWTGAWVSAQWPDSGPDQSGAPGADSLPAHLDGVGTWIDASPAAARRLIARRAPRGLGLGLRLGPAGQVSLWRHGAALACRDADDDADSLARRIGPELPAVDAVPAFAADLGWATAALPGWGPGGPLHLDCPMHGAPLTHWRCDHASAVGRKRRFLVACPECTADDVRRLGRRLGGLLAARAALDAELAEPTASGSTHRVYVVEILSGDGEPGFYVGQTTRPVEERIAQHRTSGPGAARVFRRGARPGQLRPDLIAEEWVLPTRSAALAAEALTHLRIEVLHPEADVHGDVALLA